MQAALHPGTGDTFLFCGSRGVRALSTLLHVGQGLQIKGPSTSASTPCCHAFRQLNQATQQVCQPLRRVREGSAPACGSGRAGWPACCAPLRAPAAAPPACARPLPPKAICRCCRHQICCGPGGTAMQLSQVPNRMCLLWCQRAFTVASPIPAATGPWRRHSYLPSASMRAPPG